MRFIKQQTTNTRNIVGKGVTYESDEQVIIDSTNVMLVPKGTTAERPSTPNNGHIRYNTDDNEFEAYQNSQWRKLRFKEPVSIVQQNLGTGDEIETIFGPLNNSDTVNPDPASAQALMVFIENVYQISTTNYTLEQSVSGSLAGPNAPYADGWYIAFSSAVPLGKPVTVIHNFDK